MNDDDYDFDTAENSRLSALFRKEYGDGDSSLKYKAPKQPDKLQNSVSSTNSKTFYKYIKLYQMSNEKLHGKYITAIVNSKQGIPEILIYQTKNNIFIRYQVHEKSLYTFDKTTLILHEHSESFKLEFENGKDLLEFTREYARNGGLIEIFTDLSVSNSSGNMKPQFELDVEINTGGSTDDTKSVKNEKSVIVTRLEKMGLPLLPAFPEVKSQVKNTPILKDNEIIYTNSSNNDEIDNNCHGKDETSNFIAGEHTKSKEVVSESVITKDQSDLLTSLLISNQTNSSQLTEAILLFTSKLKEMNLSKESDSKREIKKLKSKVKSLELKAENLQSELDKCYKKRNDSLYQQHPGKEVEMCNIACQTNNSEDIEKENNSASFLIQLLGTMKSFPLNTKQIGKLKLLKDGIQDEELNKSVQPYFDFFENKDTVESQSNNEGSRNEFFTQLKKIMNDMYQNVISSIDGDTDAKNLLARQVKLASVEILKAYEK